MLPSWVVDSIVEELEGDQLKDTVKAEEISAESELDTAVGDAFNIT